MKRRGRVWKWSWSNYRYYLDICLEGSRKTTKNSIITARDPEYKTSRQQQQQ
jgi:hypothetical protein